MTINFEEIYYEAESFWAESALTDPGNVARIEGTIDLVPRGVTSLLDVGCGNGVFGHELLRRRPEISLHGIDRSVAALRHVKFEHSKGSADALPFGSRSFECVTCLQVIEHLPVQSYEKALSELARVTKRYLIIGVPYREDLENEIATCPSCKCRFNINLHFRSFDDSTLQSLFANKGGRMIGMIFPTCRIRPKYINEAVALLRGRSQVVGFMSPICPLCGYSEGDKTPLSDQAKIIINPNVVENNKKKNRLRAAIVQAMKMLIPKEEVKGYWVVCLYDLSVG